MDEMIKVPDFVVLQSFRYVLGRMTYAVGMWIEWALKAWDEFPVHIQDQIRKELGEEIERDKKRNDAHNHDQYGPLGMDMDRQKWIQFNNSIMKRTK